MWLTVLFPQEGDGDAVRSLIQEVAPKLKELKIVNVGPRIVSELDHNGEGGGGTLNGIFFPRLKTFSARHWDQYLLNFDMPVLAVLDLQRIVSFHTTPIFPSSIVHLEIILEHEPDSVLRRIIFQLQQLKRLHLGKSKISDSGITGIEQEDLKQLPFDSASAEKRRKLDMDSLRKHPFIGNLKSELKWNLEWNVLITRLSFYVTFS